MNTLKQHALALSIIGLLLSLKFIVIPVMEWQDQQVTQISLLQRKVAKLTQLIDSRESLTAQLKAEQNEFDKVSHLFFKFETAEKFKREKQQQEEQEIKNHDLKISGIGWKNQQKLGDAPITVFDLEYTVKGRMDKIVNYITEIASASPYKERTAINLMFSRHRAGNLSTVTARINLRYYMLDCQGETCQTEMTNNGVGQ